MEIGILGLAPVLLASDRDIALEAAYDLAEDLNLPTSCAQEWVARYWPIDFDYQAARRKAEWLALPESARKNGEAVARSKPR